MRTCTHNSNAVLEERMLFTENDYLVARYILMKICLADALSNGLNDTVLDYGESSPETFIGGFLLIEPVYDVDSDFTFAYNMNGTYLLETVYDICDFEPTVECRNDFITDNRDIIVLPRARYAATSNDAFRFDWNEQVRPLLEMLNYDGSYDNQIMEFDSRNR